MEMMCIKNKCSLYLSCSLSVTLSLFPSLSPFHSHTDTHTPVTTLITFLFPSPQIKFLKVEMEKKTKIIKDLQQEVSPPGSARGLNRTPPHFITMFLFSCYFVLFGFFFPSWCLAVCDARGHRDTGTLSCCQLSSQWQHFQAILIDVGLKQCDKLYYLVFGSLAGGLKRKSCSQTRRRLRKRTRGPLNVSLPRQCGAFRATCRWVPVNCLRCRGG